MYKIHNMDILQCIKYIIWILTSDPLLVSDQACINCKILYFQYIDSEQLSLVFQYPLSTAR